MLCLVANVSRKGPLSFKDGYFQGGTELNSGKILVTGVGTMVERPSSVGPESLAVRLEGIRVGSSAAEDVPKELTVVRDDVVEESSVVAEDIIEESSTEMDEDRLFEEA
jgi:hypothetical protein